MADKKSTPKTAVKKTATKKTAVKKTASTKSTAKSSPAVKTGEINKLRIKISAYEHKVLDASVKQILDTALRYDGNVRGPIPLPTDSRKYTVNRSPFIDKDSREQFQMKVHKRLLDVMNPSPKIIEALANIELASGVGIDLKML